MKKNFIKTALMMGLMVIVPVLLTGCSSNSDDDKIPAPKFKSTETLVVSDGDEVFLPFNDGSIVDAKDGYELYLDDVKQQALIQSSGGISGAAFMARYQPVLEGKELQITLRNKEGKIIATGGKIKILRIYVLLRGNVYTGGPGSCLYLCDDGSLLSMDRMGFFIHLQYPGSPITKFERSTENFTVPNLASDAAPTHSYLQDDIQRVGLAKVGNNTYFYQMFYNTITQQKDYVHAILTYDGTSVKPYMEARSDFPKIVSDIQPDSEGTLFVACHGIPAIFKMDKVRNTYIFAGSETESGYKDGTGNVARFKNISMIKMDKNNNIYVAEETKIRKITPAGEVTTAVGTNESADIAGSFDNARFESIKGMTVGSDGKIYVMEGKGMSLKIIDMEKRTVEKYKIMDGRFNIPAVHNPNIELMPGTIHYQMTEKNGTIFVNYWSMNSGPARAYEIGVIVPNDIYREQQ